MSQQDPTLQYATNFSQDNSRLLVLLAVIFNYVMAGLDCAYGLFYAGTTIFMAYMFKRMAAMPPVTMPGTMPGATTTFYSRSAAPPDFIFILYLGFAALSIAAGIVKIIGVNNLRKRTPRAWGWGLAVGIMSCMQLWCSVMCVIPMAVGVYTIIILCFERVRAHLAAGPATLNPYSTREVPTYLPPQPPVSPPPPPAV